MRYIIELKYVDSDRYTYKYISIRFNYILVAKIKKQNGYSS